MKSDELPGHVAVFDGELYPLEDFEVSVEKDVSGGVMLSGQQFTSTEEEVSGTMETYREMPRPAELGRPEQHDIYLFPRDRGTRGRFFLEGVFITSFSESVSSRTQTIEFIAKDWEHDHKT